MDTENFFAEAHALVESGDCALASAMLLGYLTSRMEGERVTPGTDAEAERLTNHILTRIRLDQGTKNFQA